ncbi:MAG: hypothetical protein ACI9CO_002055 [Candidatus Azotimanducaceae bacterium]|jgi:hypothetical protein
MLLRHVLLIAAFALTLSPAAHSDQRDDLNTLAKEKFSSWLNNPLVAKEIIAQNVRTSGLSDNAVIKLDKQWRAETDASSKPMIDATLANTLSKYLRSVKESSEGLYTEIFVMDAKGLNVGQSDVTSDYWQGDEAKWQKTFSMGAGAIHVGDIEMDESTQQFQAQVSQSIVDASGKVIGAVTVGVNVDEL